MKRVMLTFDDGPSEFTPKILDILKEADIKATFFVLGKNIEKHSDIVKRIKSDGHTVANHGFSHHPLKSSLGLNFAEIEKTQKLIEQIVPKAEKLFRPPYGIIKNPLLKGKLKKTGYKVVMFDIVGKDWEKGITSDQIVANVTSQFFDGAIILLHDGFGSHDTGQRSETVKALPVIIKAIREKGYEFLRP